MADAPVAAALRVVAAVVRRGREVLMTQRPPGGPLGLMWEFPGGKLEPGESLGTALEREIAEELGVAATPGETLAIERHRYPHGLEVEVAFVACTLAAGEFTTSAAVHAWRWVAPGDVDPAHVLEADRPFLARLARPSGGAER
ncbi:MAG TPA: NUDIX domain-containing protein [Candidatus Eisenbacteria bacterium]|nr:NUDIX domain-containing protein [Candidatus Eisenbacteria bacterium]